MNGGRKINYKGAQTQHGGRGQRQSAHLQTEGSRPKCLSTRCVICTSHISFTYTTHIHTQPLSPPSGQSDVWA